MIFSAWVSNGKVPSPSLGTLRWCTARSLGASIGSPVPR